MKLTNILAISAVAALSACSGGGETAPAAGDTAQEAAEAPSTATAELTGEFLQGEWCYDHYEGGDTVTEEKINYVFNADGTLKYQNNPATPVDKDGSYAFENGALVITPAMQLIPLEPVSVEEQTMVFASMGGQFFWTRGACAE